MQELSLLKEEKRPGTPLFLFECKCSATQVFYWSSHKVTVDGKAYEARVLDHSPLEYSLSTGEESAFSPRMSVRLANADHALSSITAEQLWKGAELIIRFVVYDLEGGQQSCDAVVMMRGSVNAPDEVDFRSIRLSVVNLLGAYRSYLPSMRIQKRCAWLFPRNADERNEAALSGGGARYSPFYGCGYSAGVAGGVGNEATGGPHTSCNYTKANCVERGMYDEDANQAVTRRFSGFEFVPVTRLVRGYGEKASILSTPVMSDALSRELIPLAYGTVWTDGIVTIAQSDGNLHRMEVVLCSGPIASVIKVVVEGVEIPVGISDLDMTATGWYNTVSDGNRTGAFNLDFRNEDGAALGDPNGSTAVLSVVVPRAVVGNKISVDVQVLLQGLILPTYDSAGDYAGDAFTSNPAWVLLDVMRRSGYQEAELDLGSFAVAAAHCAEVVASSDSNGNEILAPRSDCNVLLRAKRAVAEIIRGIQIGSGVTLRLSGVGRIEAFVEATLAVQHPTATTGSNAASSVDGGWPSYEFGDGTDGISGILLTPRGEPTLRLFSRSHAETANRVSIELIDPVNDYIPDTYTLVDLDDVLQMGQEVSARIAAVGVTGYAQARRVCRKMLAKNMAGNLYAEFETSIKAIALRPGDLITINVPSAGLLRKPFRVLAVTPGYNGERIKIRAQVHKDEWYTGSGEDSYDLGRGHSSALNGDARPLLGDEVGEDGRAVFSVQEESIEASDGTQLVRLSVGYTVPTRGSGVLLARPLVSLIAEVLPFGGEIAGARNLYYAVTEINATGQESQVSSTIHAYIPAGVSSASVRLRDIRMSSAGVAINVYRGNDPWRILRIATNVPVSSEYLDVGGMATPFGPPDPNFVKACFEWRAEYLPPVAVSAATPLSVTVSGVVLTSGGLRNKTIRIDEGTGAGQERVVIDNTENLIQIAQKWNTIPDTSSRVCVVDSGWNAGGESSTSPVMFEVPNQSGSVIHLRGYALNGAGVQSRKDLASVVRHTIGGASGGDYDADVPGVPTFGIAAGERGLVEVGGIGFSDQANTSSISSGTIQIHYQDELNLTPLCNIVSGMTSMSEVFTGSLAVALGAGTILRVGDELLRLVSSTSVGVEYDVERGIFGTVASNHDPGSAVYRIQRKVSTIPIPKQFFGSASSGDFSYAIPMPNTRVVAADLFFTNSKGNSEAGCVNFCSLSDGGLRILSGGQISMQVGGFLAIQSTVVPPIVVEEPHAVRDIFAVLKEPPVGAPVVMNIKRGSDNLCVLTILAGERMSNIVSGVSVSPLLSMDQLSLDIVSVGQGASTLPGRDLTVTIRL